jgi:hypothetical protein
MNVMIYDLGDIKDGFAIHIGREIPPVRSLSMPTPRMPFIVIDIDGRVNS